MPRKVGPTADGWTALKVQNPSKMLSVGRAERLLKGALAGIAIVHPPCILKRASNYQKLLAPPLHNLLSLWVPGTATPNLLSLLNHLGNRMPWKFRCFPPALQTPARETQERAPETPGNPVRQLLPLTALDSCFPSYNNKTSDYEATTRCTFTDSSFLWFFCNFSHFCLTLIWLLIPSMDLLSSSPSRTRLLLYPWDTYFYPGRTHYDKRSRAKNMEGRKKWRMLTWPMIFYCFLLFFNLIKVL